MATPAGAESQPCYSMRLIRPFLKVFGKDPRFPKELLDPLWAMDPDDRMPIAVAFELLRGGIAINGDETSPQGCGRGRARTTTA